MIAYELSGCPHADPNALVDKLTSLKVFGVQAIATNDARAVSDALRCNIEGAAKKAVAPAIIITTVAAITGILAAVIATHR